ncbi:Potassium channel, partial [Podochytrium sp. JEL0797]
MIPSHCQFHAALLVPVSTFLTLQSFTTPVDWHAVNPGLAGSNHVALFCGSISTLAVFLQIESSAASSKGVVIGSILQGSIQFVQVVYYVATWNPSNPVSVFIHDGALFSVASATTSFLAVVWATRSRPGACKTLTSFQTQAVSLTICLMAYITIGALIYTVVEGWNLNDSIYFMVSVVTAIGFGDWYPKTVVGKLVLFPSACVGMLMVGLLLYTMRKAMKEGRGGGIDRVESICSSASSVSLSDSSSDVSHSMDIASPPVPVVKLSKNTFLDAVLFSAPHLRSKMLTCFHAQIQSPQINLAFIYLVFYILASAAVFSWLEGWSLFDSVYFTFTTLTTLGFGDLSPKTQGSKSLLVWFVAGGVGGMAAIGSMIGERVMGMWRKEEEAGVGGERLEGVVVCAGLVHGFVKGYGAIAASGGGGAGEGR